MINNKISNLRVIAILFVVLGHSVIIFDPTWGVYNTNYSSTILYSLKQLINGFQMHLFFSISGFLFFYSMQKAVSFADFIKNKFTRLLVPFTLVGLFFLIPVRFAANYPPYFEKGNNIGKIVLSFISTNDCGHLWFLPTLFLIFAGAYFLLKLKDRYKINNFLIVIFSLLLTFSSTFIPSFIPCFNLSIKWFFYFIIGYYINMYGKGLFSQKYNHLYKILILFYPLLIYLRLMDFGYWNMLIRINYSCVTILLFYYYITNKKYIFMSFLDKNSFGIYLFHAPIIYLLMDNLFYLKPFELASINFLVSVLFSLGLTLLIRAFNFNFILGENNNYENKKIKH